MRAVENLSGKRWGRREKEKKTTYENAGFPPPRICPKTACIGRSRRRHRTQIDPASPPPPFLSPRDAISGIIVGAALSRRRHRKSVNCKRIRVGPGVASHFSYLARGQATSARTRDISAPHLISDLWTISRAARGHTRKIEIRFYFRLPSTLSLFEMKPIIFPLFFFLF